MTFKSEFISLRDKVCVYFMHVCVYILCDVYMCVCILCDVYMCVYIFV